MTAICVQAAPFLVLGVVVSGAVAAFVPASMLHRFVPGHPVGAVTAAGLAGVLLPGCECASVPVSQSLMKRGIPPAAALTFLLAAPAINPVVLVATVVAFPAQPYMVHARFLASLIAAITVGLLWVRFGQSGWLAEQRQPDSLATPRGELFRRTAVHDFLHAGGFLVVGSAIAATLHVVVPKALVDTLSGTWMLSIATMAVLAVLVAVCSEADAFVAASFTSFSPTAQLVFMVVSPMVDVKLVAMQVGAFGPSFALRFAPATFLVATLASVAIGSLVL